MHVAAVSEGRCTLLECRRTRTAAELSVLVHCQWLVGCLDLLVFDLVSKDGIGTLAMGFASTSSTFRLRTRIVRIPGTRNWSRRGMSSLVIFFFWAGLHPFRVPWDRTGSELEPSYFLAACYWPPSPKGAEERSECVAILAVAAVIYGLINFCWQTMLLTPQESI